MPADRLRHEHVEAAGLERLDDRVGDVLGLDGLEAARLGRPEPSSVLTTTGITTLISMFVSRTSARIASLSPTTACLVAQ